MPRNILKCTIAEANRASENNWMVQFIELEKFVGLILARGVVVGRICVQKYVTYILGLSFVQCYYAILDSWKS